MGAPWSEDFTCCLCLGRAADPRVVTTWLPAPARRLLPMADEALFPQEKRQRYPGVLLSFI